jgi:hypothetical protein
VCPRITRSELIEDRTPPQTEQKGKADTDRCRN